MNKAVQSFSKSGRPHDNAVAESFFASMKREGIYQTQYHSECQFMRSVDTCIEFYNTKRPTARSTIRRRMGPNCSMCKEKGEQGELDKGFKNWVFSVFQLSSLRLLSL